MWRGARGCFDQTGLRSMALNQPFRLSGLISRLAFSLLIVFVPYNPTGYSFYHWLIDMGSGLISLKILIFLLLAIVYWALVRIGFGAFRLSGLIAASLAALLFSFIVITGVVPHAAGASWSFYFVLAQYIVLVAFAIVIAFGLSWSFIIERLTGQKQKHYV